MAVNVPALVAVVFFYIIIVAIGFWAFRKSKKVEKTVGGSKTEITIVGGRNINVPVGILTLTGRKTIYLVRHDARGTFLPTSFSIVSLINHSIKLN